MLLLTSYLFPSTHCFWTDCQNILMNVLSFITQEECDQDQTYFVRHTKILSLKLLFKRRVAHEMPFALEEIIMKDVSRNIQLWICRICGKITVCRNAYVSTTRALIVNKIGKVMTYNNKLPSIK